MTTDNRRVEGEIRALLRDDVPAMKPWRVLYVEHCNYLLAKVEQLDKQFAKCRQVQKRDKHSSVTCECVTTVLAEKDAELSGLKVLHETAQQDIRDLRAEVGNLRLAEHCAVHRCGYQQANWDIAMAIETVNQSVRRYMKINESQQAEIATLTARLAELQSEQG